MVRLPAGEIVLKQVGTRRTWPVALNAFSIARHPVSRTLFHSVMTRGDGGDERNLPMTDVSWTETIEFCNPLSAVCRRTPGYSVGSAT